MWLNIVGNQVIVCAFFHERYQPWRAKRRLVDPSSREAALFSRRALRQRENKVVPVYKCQIIEIQLKNRKKDDEKSGAGWYNYDLKH